jgi:hypothetical protein
MKDEIIRRILDETCQALKGVHFPVQTPHLIPSYNALLTAAKDNHPNDSFLRVLEPLEPGESGPEEMRVLFAQLRIVLESYMEDFNGYDRGNDRGDARDRDRERERNRDRDRGRGPVPSDREE